MLKVRLQRVGRKNNPSFRVVVTDSKNGPKSGRFVEILGSYDARQGEPELKAERIKYWISQGAKTSGTVNNLLVRKKVIAGKKINVLPGKSKKDLAAEAEAKAVAAKEAALAATKAEATTPGETLKSEEKAEVASAEAPKDQEPVIVVETEEKAPTEATAVSEGEDKLSIDKETPSA